MKRKFFKCSTMAAMLSLGLFLAAPGAYAQTRGGGGQQQGGTQPGQQNNPDNMQRPGGMNGQSNAEMTFVANMRRNSKVETDLSKMALKNSSNDGVKSFAQQVIKENRHNDMALTSATANSNSTQMPFIADAPSETRKAEKQMKKLTGTQFDEMYLSQMDGYVMNDQKITADASSAMTTSDMASVVMQLRNSADDRAKQLAQIAQSENFKIGAPQ